MLWHTVGVSLSWSNWRLLRRDLVVKIPEGDQPRNLSEFAQKSGEPHQTGCSRSHDIGFQLMRSYGDGYRLRDCEKIDLGMERRQRALHR